MLYFIYYNLQYVIAKYKGLTYEFLKIFIFFAIFIIFLNINFFSFNSSRYFELEMRDLRVLNLKFKFLKKLAVLN